MGFLKAVRVDLSMAGSERRLIVCFCAKLQSRLFSHNYFSTLRWSQKTTEAMEEITFRNFEFLISAFGRPGHLVGSLKSLKCKIWETFRTIFVTWKSWIPKYFIHFYFFLADSQWLHNCNDRGRDALRQAWSFALGSGAAIGHLYFLDLPK